MDWNYKTLEQTQLEAFQDGVRYALNRLEEVFGTEVTETDVWKEYNPDNEGEDN
jgi:hypothetical protein